MVSKEALAATITAMEQQYDARFKVVFDAIGELMKPPAKSTERIGFRTNRARALPDFALRNASPCTEAIGAEPNLGRHAVVRPLSVDAASLAP